MRTEQAGEEGNGAARLFFAPLNDLPSRVRWLTILGAVALTVGWSAWRNGNLMIAWGLPDVQFYFHIADGRMDLVPQPFSARPLAPLLARTIAQTLHIWNPGGFAVLAYLCLTWTAAVVFWLLTKTAAPRWMLLALAVVPFWTQLLQDAGLPDPLYAALLACFLLALERDWLYAAAALMFPLMLARESTTLTLVCLLLVGWRRLRWGRGLLAVAGVALGALIVRHLAAPGLPNPEHMSGGLYMAGKMASNLARTFGVIPWSNVYPELCGTPAWQVPLHLAQVRAVGVCAMTPVSPSQAVQALLTTFGVLPAVLAANWRRCRELWRHGSLTLRFCLVYGAISLAIAPALGTWYTRLFGYGWPLLLVVAPRLLGRPNTPAARVTSGRILTLGAALLLMHLVVCALGNRPVNAALLSAVIASEAAAFALLLVHRRDAERVPESTGFRRPAC